MIMLFACNMFQENTVWLVETPSDVQEDCTSTVDHNIIVEEYEDDEEYVSEWTYESSSEYSPQLSLFQTSINGKEGVLFIGGVIVPGQKDGSSWVFNWNDNNQTKSERRHESSYVYINESTSDSQFVMTLDTRTETGTLTVRISSQSSIYETDRWSSDEVGMYSGDLYAYSVGGGGNYAEDTDCEGNDNMCFINTTSECASNTAFKVTKTALDSIDGFEYYRSPSNGNSSDYDYDYDYDTGWW